MCINTGTWSESFGVCDGVPVKETPMAAATEILSPQPKVEGSGAPLCEICATRPSLYRCPGCSRRTCSVACVKKHKVEFGCSGVRCKTAFVSLSDFTDQHLLSDYYFLEEVGQLAESAHRSVAAFDRGNCSSKDSRTFYWLKKYADERGTVLRLLPTGMFRRTINTSRTVRHGGGRKGHHRKQWVIQWRVHLSFPECEASYQVERVSEEKILGVFLEHYVHPKHSDPLVRHRLQSHVAKGGVAAVEVWLDGGMMRGSHHYHLLDLDLSLKENLKNKTITEFPELIVLSKGTGPPKTQSGQTHHTVERFSRRIGGQNTVNAKTLDAMTILEVKDGSKPAQSQTVVKTESAMEAEGVMGSNSVGSAMEAAQSILKTEDGSGLAQCEGWRGGDGSDWSDGECSDSVEEGEITDTAACPSASLRMIANVYSDSEESSS